MALTTTKINFGRNWRQDLEQLVTQALQARVFPGLVVHVSRGEEVLLHQAWGQLEIGPEATAMAPDTLFDIASITKPVATASCLMVLLERGKLSLEDKAAEYFPEFDTIEKQGITLRHLLTHTSGLPALVDLYQEKPSRAEALQKLMHLPLQYPTGSAMVYGDPNFLILGELVRRVSGQTLAEYFHQNIAHPLGLSHTCFNPLERGEWNVPIAPTQYCPYRQQLLRGVVHDENAWVFGGEGGNAGLFSNAPDLARFCRMIHQRGALNGVRLFSPRTVEVMTANHNPPKLPPRGLGWDMKGEGFGYMSCGMLMPTGTIGHTGFTGTSLWTVPQTGFTIILLTNRVHISREKNQKEMIRLRPRLHNLLYAALAN